MADRSPFAGSARCETLPIEFAKWRTDNAMSIVRMTATAWRLPSGSYWRFFEIIRALLVQRHNRTVAKNVRVSPYNGVAGSTVRFMPRASRSSFRTPNGSHSAVARPREPKPERRAACRD